MMMLLLLGVLTVAIIRLELLIRQDYLFVGLNAKIESVIRNCILYILTNRKQGKRQGYFHSINKGNCLLMTWHIYFLGTMETTSKGYKHILWYSMSILNFIGYSRQRALQYSK